MPLNGLKWATSVTKTKKPDDYDRGRQIVAAYERLVNLLWAAYLEFYPGDEWLDPEVALRRLISDLRRLRKGKIEPKLLYKGDF